MTPEDLSKIEAAAAAALPAPWVVEPAPGEDRYWISAPETTVGLLHLEHRASPADAELIALAVSSLPALSSALREAWGRIEELERVRIAELKDALDRAARSHERIVALEAELKPHRERDAIFSKWREERLAKAEEVGESKPPPCTHIEWPADMPPEEELGKHSASEIRKRWPRQFCGICNMISYRDYMHYIAGDY